MIFLALFPKSPINDENNDLSQLAEAACRSFAPFLGPRYPESPTFDKDVTTNGGILVKFVPTAQHSLPFHRVRKGRWTVATSPNVVDEILAHVTSKTGKLRYESPVWGLSLIHI